MANTRNPLHTSTLNPDGETAPTRPPYFMIYNPHVRREIGPGTSGLITVEPAERDPGRVPVGPVGGWLHSVNTVSGARTYADNPAHAMRIAPDLKPHCHLAPGETWHVPGDPAVILDCGHPESPHGEITSGWGIDAEGKRHCLACCYARDLARMERGEPITAYLSTAPDGAHVITTWNGQIMARVSSVRTVSCGGFARNHKRAVWRARGVRGGDYHGTGPRPGMYTRVRKSSAKRSRPF